MSNFWGLHIYNVAITITYQVIFNQISIIHDYISSQVVDKRRQGFGQWMNPSIIHDNICKLIHKKCHLKSYHSDIKYHMTLYVYIYDMYNGVTPKLAPCAILGIMPTLLPALTPSQALKFFYLYMIF